MPHRREFPEVPFEQFCRYCDFCQSNRLKTKKMNCEHEKHERMDLIWEQKMHTSLSCPCNTPQFQVLWPEIHLILHQFCIYQVKLCPNRWKNVDPSNLLKVFSTLSLTKKIKWPLFYQPYFYMFLAYHQFVVDTNLGVHFFRLHHSTVAKFSIK